MDENKNNQQNGTNANDDDDSTETHVIQTIHRGQRFSKKLKRRLTIRTIAEAKALKQQSQDAIHVLIYAAELVSSYDIYHYKSCPLSRPLFSHPQIVTDPKLALQKTRELWAYLSEDEPGNQARPETLEQLVVLLTRETARRVVHFINFTANVVPKLPDSLKKTQHVMMQQLINVTKYLANLIKTRPITTRLNQEVVAFQDRISCLYDEVQNYATNRLVNNLGQDQSMALVPYTFPLTPASTNDVDHHHLSPLPTTNHNTSIHLHFQCSIHTVISAVSGRTCGHPEGRF